eukprot:g16364.t1
MNTNRSKSATGRLPFPSLVLPKSAALLAGEKSRPKQTVPLPLTPAAYKLKQIVAPGHVVPGQVASGEVVLLLRAADVGFRFSVAGSQLPARVQENYRTRAAYKLKQIDHKFSIFRKNQIVLDLGCYSGGWSQVALERTAKADENQLAGDANEKKTLEKVLKATNNEKVDVVLSDMCAAIQGNKVDDHLASASLCLAAGELMERVLKMYGPETSNYNMYLKTRFANVMSFKPKASRVLNDITFASRVSKYIL